MTTVVCKECREGTCHSRPPAESEGPIDADAVEAQLDRIEAVVSAVDKRCDARYGELNNVNHREWHIYRQLLLKIFLYEGAI